MPEAQSSRERLLGRFFGSMNELVQVEICLFEYQQGLVEDEQVVPCLGRAPSSKCGLRGSRSIQGLAIDRNIFGNMMLSHFAYIHRCIVSCCEDRKTGYFVSVALG